MSLSCLGTSSTFDITYLVDASEATSDEQLEKLKQIIKAEVSGYKQLKEKVKEFKTRVSIISYGQNPELILSLEDGDNLDAIYQSLNTLTKRGGKPDLERAVRLAQQTLLLERYREPKILVAMAARKPSISSLYGIKKQMEEAKKKGIKLIVVGLDTNVLSHGLDGITNVHKGGITVTQKDKFDLLEKLSFAVSQATGKLISAKKILNLMRFSDLLTRILA